MLSWLLVGLSFAVSTPASVPDPRVQESWIADEANVISDAAEVELNASLQQLYVAKGAEFIVVTLDAVDRDAADFSKALFQEWGVGVRHLDRGLLMLVVMEGERLELVTGAGLDADLPYQWVSQMQVGVILPALAEGDFDAAVRGAFQAVDARIAAVPRVPEEYIPEAREPSLMDAVADVPATVWVGLALVGTVLLLLLGGRALMSSDAAGAQDEEDTKP